MSRVLAQSINIPGLVAGRRHVRMMYATQTATIRLSGFSGLRPVNSLDSMLRYKQDFHSKVLTQIGTNRVRGGRGSRCVTRAIFHHFSEKPVKVIMLAQDEARRLGHNFVGTEQILLGIIREGTGIGAKVLKSMGINLKDSRVEVEKIIGRGSGFVAVEIPFTPRAKRVLELSLEEARQLGHNYIGTENLLLDLLREGEGVAARVLENLGDDPTNIRTQGNRLFAWLVRVVTMLVLEVVIARCQLWRNMAVWHQFDQASRGGRQPQIERVTQILGRRTKNNPCLIGEPGVGKTAIAEGLAQRIANGDVPETIEGKQVITLDMGLLVAGSKYRGEFEERLNKLMEEIKQSDEIILFIDEVHTLIGAGAAEGVIDATNILKPAIARATTLDEYRKHIEEDPALERKFQPVKVLEPTVSETIQILKGLRERYEIHHKLRYTDDARVAAAGLSHQYISGRFLPDKAIDLIDEAGSRVRLQPQHAQLPEEARGLEKEVRQIVKEKDEAIRDQEFEKAGELRDIEMDLKTQISALIQKNKEMSKAESEAGDVVALVTEVDIQHIVAAWTGIPVDKDGRLTDSKGRTVDFKNTLLIMTSNVGSSADLDYDEKDNSYNRIKSLVIEELKQYFRPEFLNRLDEMIVFRQLTKLEAKELGDS
ncbi:putative UVR domain, chaperonin ClpB, P-loop containing nucleoside triphosphate hydrolase [Medicago truncatula]|uniref:Putative UVR domain, chaperonin ClpB, P-loop containing nucleoside triphosphate hydrolase n=1 Tax=Medicago truncatula TaxID=3880 RepID=A0A396IXI3_MEDTR|nr:putative UVR domain, chaperonin ClpB, P-loop containing nucleoside triphosphate hydrolase [Medicago truncatula]